MRWIALHRIFASVQNFLRLPPVSSLWPEDRPESRSRLSTWVNFLQDRITDISGKLRNPPIDVLYVRGADLPFTIINYC